MADPVITNIDNSELIIHGSAFQDEVLTFAGAATVVKGTILARDSSTLKLVPFVKGGVTDGNGIPKAIATSDIVAAGAGDEPLRALVSGEVRADQLIINADGDNSNVDATVLDQLRDYTLITAVVVELNFLDNQ